MPSTNNFYIVRIRSKFDSKKQLQQMLEEEKRTENILDYEIIETSSKIKED